MPSFVLNTSVPKTSIPDDFLVELSKMIAGLVGKPETYVSVHVNPDQMMTFGGTNEPCVLASFSCIGKMGVEENKAYSAKIFEYIQKKLGINPKRMYINYYDMPRKDVGWNSTTFA